MQRVRKIITSYRTGCVSPVVERIQVIRTWTRAEHPKILTDGNLVGPNEAFASYVGSSRISRSEGSETLVSRVIVTSLAGMATGCLMGVHGTTRKPCTPFGVQVVDEDAGYRVRDLTDA